MEVNDLSGIQYSVNKNIVFKTPMLRSDMYDYGDRNFVVKGTISLKVNGNNYMPEKDVLKNIAPFRSWITKISSMVIGNAEDLDIVMSIYNLFIVTIILWHQEVYGIIREMKLMIL